MRNEIINEMVAETKEKYGEIYPVSTRETLADCITSFDGVPTLWFNDTSGSTHIVMGDSE